MTRIERIQSKIGKMEALLGKIQALLAEVKAGVKELSRESRPTKTRRPSPSASALPTEEECRAEFDRLYEEHIRGHTEAVKQFVGAKSKNYLTVFCKANHLPVNARRASKERVASELSQWLAQRKAITGRLSSL